MSSSFSLNSSLNIESTYDVITQFVAKELPGGKEILDGIMSRWERKEGRKGLPGIHDYYWETPQALANDEAMIV